MLRREKEKVMIYDDDTTYLNLEITAMQPGEGVYRFYPEPEDELKMTIYARKVLVRDPDNPDETLVVDVIDEKDEELSFYMETEDGEIVSFSTNEFTPIRDPIAEFDFSVNDPENIVLKLDTTAIEAGTYWYDIALRIDADDEVYHIAVRKTIEIKRREKPQ